MSDPKLSEKAAAVYIVLKDLPPFQKLTAQIQSVVIAGLTERNLIGVLRDSGMTEDVALLVIGGLARNEAVVQTVFAYSFGLLWKAEETPAPPLPDGNTPLTATAPETPQPTTDEANKQIAELPVATLSDAAVEGLMRLEKPSEQVKQKQFVRELIAKTERAVKNQRQPEILVYVN